MSQFKSKLMFASSLTMLTVFGLNPAAAQTAPAAEEDVAAREIVVTGTRIRAASDSGAIAVSTINRDQIETLGQSSTGELLENLAQAGTFEINGAADGPNDARGDIATVNLRGLGTGNTLVLLNGRRIAAHAVNQDIGSTPRQVTNVNAFPSAGVDRFEVLRDGASALYGADATAGVVNTILSTDFDSTRLTARIARTEDTDHGEESIDLAHGFHFNEGRSRVLLVGSIFTRNGLYSSELDNQFSSVDKRAFLGNSPYATDNTDFRNTSTASPFGQYVVGTLQGDVFAGRRVRRGTTNLTNTAGQFHIQPCAFAGTLQQFGARGPDGCVGLDDGTLDVGLRYDFAANQPNNSLNQGVNVTQDGEQALGRQLISEAERVNAYGQFEHDFSANLEGFAEVLYYRAETASSRATQPLDSGLAFLIVPATNFWNPFGPTGSVNRIAGLNTADVPASGLSVLVEQWRPVELGSRGIFTETKTYRFLAGLRGEFGNWEWESALATSSNETSDIETNRISKTLLQAELAKSTPDAINPFGGPNANSAAQFDRVRISSTNVGETELNTWDLRFSNEELFSTWAGPVGVAFGGDWRQESYTEDRDPRLDGTVIFNTANVSGRSDVVGVSPTDDSSAERNTYSLFGEVLVPLHRGEGMFPNDLTLQVAARGEYFDDLEDGAVKPKVALSWLPTEFLNLRAAYSQGFRVPNLVQLNRGDISRLNLGIDDFWRGPVTADAASDGDAYVPSLRQANPNLRNEDTETIVVGANLDLRRSFRPKWLREFRVSLDYWRFEQTDLIGAFGDQEALALDFALRRQNSSNPNVVRAAVTAQDIADFAAYNAANPGDQRAPAGQVRFILDPYINLDSQEADGLDFGFAGGVEIGNLGRFNLDIEATQLRTLDLVRNPALTALASDPTFAGEFSTIGVDRIELDGNPEWRVLTNLTWRKGPVGAGVSVRYVSEFVDTSADIDANADGVPEFFPVDSAFRVNGYIDYEFGEKEGEFRLRLGAINLFNEPPPLVDDSLGYAPDYHWLKGREVYVQLRANF
jgi:outer membrane receptor protein involved in Fe transport